MIVLVDTKKNSTFAPAIRKGHNAWCVSSAWLECLPVTQEVTGSSPVRTANYAKNHFCMRIQRWCVSSAWLECLPVTQEVTGSSPVRTARKSQKDFLFLCTSSYP